MKTSTFSFLGLVLIGFTLVSACSPKSEGSATMAAESTKAPGFEVTTITGEVFSLEKSLKESKPTVVYFTASWCPKCAQNWPALSKLYPQYKDRINIVAIGIDPTDDASVMKNLVAEKGITFPITAGNPKVMLDFGVTDQATTVGIDKNGNVSFVKSKTVLSEEEYIELFDALLAVH